MIPGDRLLCLFVEEQSLNNKFKDWPLHLTLVPWFRSKISSDNLNIKIKSEVNNISKINIEVNGTDYFGKRKLVRLIKPNNNLSILHKTIRDVIENESKWIVDKSTKKSHEFRPHITLQKNKTVINEKKILINKIYIVKQHGNFKTIDGIINL